MGRGRTDRLGLAIHFAGMRAHQLCSGARRRRFLARSPSADQSIIAHRDCYNYVTHWAATVFVALPTDKSRAIVEDMAQAQSSVETEESAAIVPVVDIEQTAHERFGDPKNFINRELSWLEFNRRVLEEAQDSTQPLIERVKFLCIFSSNLDEFFEIRVAGIKQQIESETSDVGPDGLSPTQTFN